MEPTGSTSAPQGPFHDPFASTGPFAGPPETYRNLRLMAIALGDLHGAALDRLLRQRRESDDPIQQSRSQIDELHTRDAITDEDRERLKALMDVYAGEEEANARYGTIQQIYRAAIEDPTSSPVALAVLSIAANSAEREASLLRSDFDVGYADGAGAVAGAELGFAGGGIGSLMGALAGAALASAAAEGLGA
jgi:hypothetical protein